MQRSADSAESADAGASQCDPWVLFGPCTWFASPDRPWFGTYHHRVRFVHAVFAIAVPLHEHVVRSRLMHIARNAHPLPGKPQITSCQPGLAVGSQHRQVVVPGLSGFDRDRGRSPHRQHVVIKIARSRYVCIEPSPKWGSSGLPRSVVRFERIVACLREPQVGKKGGIRRWV